MMRVKLVILRQSLLRTFELRSDQSYSFQLLTSNPKPCRADATKEPHKPQNGEE